MGMHYVPTPVTPVPLELAQRIKFHADRRWWTVRGLTATTAVLTRQAAFHPKGTLCYTVIDWSAGVRGPVDVIGQGWEVDTDEQCQELAELVRDGEWRISQRNWVHIEFTAGVNLQSESVVR